MGMNIIVTAGEALEMGFWERLCDLKGWNVWAVNEGLMDRDDRIELTLEEAKKLGVEL